MDIIPKAPIIKPADTVRTTTFKMPHTIPRISASLGRKPCAEQPL